VRVVAHKLIHIFCAKLSLPDRQAAEGRLEKKEANITAAFAGLPNNLFA
jgi:hypothetical protein